MTATAVSTNQGIEDVAPVQRTTLTLPAGAKPQPAPTAEVVVFDEARADLPRPYVTSDEMAEEARRAGLHQREWESRERARAYLVQSAPMIPARTARPCWPGRTRIFRSPLSARMPWKRR